MSKPDPSPKPGLSLTSFFSADDILTHLEQLTRNDCIRRILTHLSDVHGFNDTDAYYDAILEREDATHTVVANGIAIPHARIMDLQRPYVGIATSEQGIPFAEDEPPVHLILLVLIPRDQPGLYLQILRALASILRDRTAAKAVSRLRTPDEVMRFFERGGMVLPDFVCAADIMEDTFISLRDNDNLKTCIDCFISQQINEIPVLDRDGDMVGVVRAGALLKVCLPEYLLWMSDLSPIVNFEPFTTVLRNEQHSCLSDILLQNFASVQMKAPAISVAGEMIRHNASRCYVLNGKKLIGVITLSRFLSKIFRE
ncbi:MAG TPA: PTS sugar transporter subunit IIA [Kiritimatiellia bacterium]|jgi:PTS system nitrogen regulatory IIA component|nr:PTS sugar transporter subunit IIA [Kiritimatiellia bacterium]HOM59091.1 PTS sugar transporter subunit IIA [Kiritimatiellia bacterium]HOR97551.1 PTS sugar transporter subunit IIA [Kiritimatiellia bacterium]HPC49481.1 PTS sugar transporter subunit IIA [Kiritimatiellia bacterium]HPK37415.1 PTS sugar transporter subunit IIA [Kiritimatiellia bacterium]